MFVVRDVNRGVCPLDWQRPCWCAPGGAGWRCRRVLVAEDVPPLNVEAVPRAIVPDILGNQGAQCVELEVVGLCFAWRRSCAEWMRLLAEWADIKVRDARAAQRVQLHGSAAAKVMPKERSAILVEYLPADAAQVSRPRMWSTTFGHPLALGHVRTALPRFHRHKQSTLDQLPRVACLLSSRAASFHQHNPSFFMSPLQSLPKVWYSYGLHINL